MVSSKWCRAWGSFGSFGSFGRFGSFGVEGWARAWLRFGRGEERAEGGGNEGEG